MKITITLEVEDESGRTKEEIAQSYCEALVENDMVIQARPGEGMRGACIHNVTCVYLDDICLSCAERELLK